MITNDDVLIGGLVEGSPAARPAGFDNEAIWRRIEQYIAYRWGVRTVEWVVKGPGLFTPPLKPVTITATEKWVADEWIPCSLLRTPFGISTGSAFYRISGTAGESEPVPADVLEAYERLRDYVKSIKDDDYQIGSSTDTVGGVTHSVRRPTAAMSRALEYSGALDILKAYRHV